MNSLRDTLLEYIDGQLDAIARTPGMWGPPIGVELQVLQLIKFRSVTVRPEFDRQNPRTVLRAYNAFLARKFPGAPPVPLAVILEQDGRTDELMQILQEFRDEQVREMSSPLGLVQQQIRTAYPDVQMVLSVPSDSQQHHKLEVIQNERLMAVFTWSDEAGFRGYKPRQGNIDIPRPDLRLTTADEAAEVADLLLQSPGLHRTAQPTLQRSNRRGAPMNVLIDGDPQRVPRTDEAA